MQTEKCKKASQFSAPISTCKVYLGSWRRHAGNSFQLGYRELASRLVPYAKWMGFTRLELLLVDGHPFDDGWDCQPAGLYAPTRRFGTRDDLRYFIDAAYVTSLNVILGWVPGHFLTDGFAPAEFDGASLYEHSDPCEGCHQNRNVLIYNHSRHKVSNLLVGNAPYQIGRFGIDAPRIDAVASMIYRDYGRREGEWIPNEFGGCENLEAIEFLRNTSRILGEQISGVVTMAGESIDFPDIPHPQDTSGLGFWYKWNLGWMRDILDYVKLDPIYRQYHHDKLTFGVLYSYTENFVLLLSHDEVVHGERSILGWMPGGAWQKLANLHVYYGWVRVSPGRELLFMGDEFAQGYK